MNKKVLSVFLALLLIVSTFAGIITFAENTDNDALNTEDISVTAYNSAVKYLKTAGNDATEEGLAEALKKVDASASIEQFFIKHAVDGVCDDATDYPLSIPGCDGYVSAIVSLKNNKVGVAVSIPHNIENLGVLTTSVYSDTNSEFKTNSRGYITGYTGTAQKIVIPSSYSGRINWAANTSNDTVKVMIIGGIDSEMNVTIGSNFKKFSSLKAVVLPRKVNGIVSVGALSSCVELEYVSLFHEISDSENVSVCNEAFKNSEKLKTAYCPCCGKISEAIYGNGVFTGTAIRDYYLPENIAYADGVSAETTFGVEPSYTLGSTVIMTAEQQKTANHTRAVTLAMQKLFEHNVSATDNKDSLLKVSTSGYDTLKSTENISADWKNTLKIKGEKVQGILYITENDVDIPIEYFYNPSAGLISLDIDGYSFSPKFDPEITEYSLSVPYTVSELKVLVHAFNGATVKSIMGNTDLQIDKDNKLVVDTVSRNGTQVKYTVTVKRLPLKKELNEKVINAFKDYVKKSGNNAELEKMVAFVNEAIAPATVSVSQDEFFIRHAVDGVFDEDPDESTRLSIPGNDGYISAVFRILENDQVVSIIGGVDIISHTETNLGLLTKSKDEDFIVDENGNLINYIGDAQKVIVPSFVKDIVTTGAKENEGLTKAIVLVTKNSGTTIKKFAFQSDLGGEFGWVNLVAADISNNLTFGEGCFSKLPSLKYVKLPQKAGTGKIIDYGAFRDDVNLENVNLPNVISLMGVVFTNTAVRDFYEPNSLSRPRKDKYHDYDQPSFTEGTRVVMTYDQQQTATLTRAATLAQAVADTIYLDENDTAESILAKITDSYNKFNKEITANWNGSFIKNDDNAKGILTLKYKDAEIDINFNCDNGRGLKDLYITDYSLSEKFDEDVTEYSVTVKNGITSLALTKILYPGAEIVSVEGNCDFVVGDDNLVTIKVRAKNGQERTYKISVTRKNPTTFEEMVAEIENTVYSDNFTNESSMATLEASIKKATKGEPFEFVIEDFYLYKAIGGATENGTTVLVPGHNGYITASVKLIGAGKTENISIKATVVPEMEDYIFNSVSKAEDFDLSADGKTLLAYEGTAEKVVIPEGVEFIDELYLFADAVGIKCMILPESLRALPTSLCYLMTDLEVVYMGDNVVKLGAGTFMNCTSLKYIRLSENLPEIGTTMFSNCISLGQLYIPQSVTQIKSNAFYKSLIRDVTISENVTLIGESAFGWCVNFGTYFANASQGSIISKEKAEYIHNNVVKKWAYKNGARVPRTITVLNDGLVLEGAVFAGDETGSWGVNAVRAVENSTTAKHISELSDGGSFAAAKNNFTILDMIPSEAAARAQIVADGIHLEKDATADMAKSIIESSYISSGIVKTEWIEPFEISGNSIKGVISLTDTIGTAWEIVIDTNVFVPAKPIEEEKEDDEDNIGDSEYIPDYEEDTDIDPDSNPKDEDNIGDTEYIPDDEDEYDDDLYNDYYNEDDYYIDNSESEENVDEQPTGEWKTVRKKIRTKMRRPGREYYYFPVYGWILIAVGVVAVIAATVITIIIVKRKKKKSTQVKI